MASDPKVIEATYITDEDVKQSAALAIVPPPAALTVARPPEIVLQEAKEAATALVELIKSKPDLTVRLNGHDYLKFEAWQTIGKFYGASPKVTETKYIEYGEIKGFEAKAVVINSGGLEVSGAEAMCMDDEPNWKKKPMFQLKSMAQTRASSKALRNVFAWVVVLAGYKPTPAEEMDGVKGRKDQSSTVQPKRVNGIVLKPVVSGGSLWFYIGEEIFQIPPMRGRDMKDLLQEADKAFVELDVIRSKGRDSKEFWQVKDIIKFEPQVPF
jgi:hypothetical protein